MTHRSPPEAMREGVALISVLYFLIVCGLAATALFWSERSRVTNVLGVRGGARLSALADSALYAALAAWQMAVRLGWTDADLMRVASGALALAAALFVILVHHLGYEEFRAEGARTKLAGALVACGVQALAFLVTGNVLAPVVAHVVLHVALVFRGVEMPPVRAIATRRGDEMRRAA